jgi:hypothetical protein
MGNHTEVIVKTVLFGQQVRLKGTGLSPYIDPATAAGL